MKDCIFCKIIRREIPGNIIDETDDIIVFLSLNNHPLIVPKKHLENIYELDDKTGEAVMREAIKISKAVKKGLKADGINLLQNNEEAGGQDVFHFHLHIKPRFKKDAVKIQFPDEENAQDKTQTVLEKIKSAL